MPTESGYAIAGKCGLYTGWKQRRIEAIAQHVSDLYHGVSQFASGGLDDEQRKAWEKCKRRGDRVVKVTISF